MIHKEIHNIYEKLIDECWSCSHGCRSCVKGFKIINLTETSITYYD